MSKLRSHMHHNLVAYLALFVALGGTAYAAGPMKRGDPAGGDLAGTYPSPTLKTCTAGQLLKYDGDAWACAADATGLTDLNLSIGASTPENPTLAFPENQTLHSRSANRARSS